LNIIIAPVSPGLFIFVKTKVISARNFTLGRGERLKSRKLIERVFREGKSFTLFPFRIYHLPAPIVPGADSIKGAAETASCPFPFLQAGFGVSSRHFKKAVDRNRIKRLTREAYRLQKQALYDHLTKKDSRLVLFIIYTGKELPDYPLVTEKIGLALEKLIKEVVK
jgi:ribonuclease P protein component